MCELHSMLVNFDLCTPEHKHTELMHAHPKLILRQPLSECGESAGVTVSGENATVRAADRARVEGTRACMLLGTGLETYLWGWPRLCYEVYVYHLG